MRITWPPPRGRFRPCVFGRDVYLARVRAGSLADRSAWRSWTGARWVADQARAARLEQAGTDGSHPFSVDKIGDTPTCRSTAEGSW